MSSRRVLVVGTTPDYIDHIYRECPGGAVFITERRVRMRAQEPAPDAAAEVLCNLDDPQDVLPMLRDHLAQHDLIPCGVACFDCESMQLASQVATEYSLPYPSSAAVAACRSKSVSKRRWHEAGLPCPRLCQVEDADGLLRFFRELPRKKLVLKPLTGAGSELLFVCECEEDCVRSLALMQQRLAAHHDTRMYAAYADAGHQIDPRTTVLAEEFIEGSEYSCDFIVDGDRVEIIRIARKVPAADLGPGMTLGYEVPATLPAYIEEEAFSALLQRAAHAVGLSRSICMLDLIMDGSRPVLIEIAPRPGGDCLPPLIRRSSGLDILTLALEFAAGGRVAIPPRAQWEHLVGLRLITSGQGIISAIDERLLRDDPRVLAVELAKGPGARVVQPPEDYDSRVLGHAIFKPASAAQVDAECRALAEKLHVAFSAQ